MVCNPTFDEKISVKFIVKAGKKIEQKQKIHAPLIANSKQI